MLSLLLGCAACATPRGSAEASDIFHYVRSNQDGSEPENVVQYRPSRTSVAVYKWVEKCTTAAYVTARMNAAVTEGERYIAGKVAPDGTQSRFGTLDLQSSSSKLKADIRPAGADRIQAEHQLAGRPYIIFDFDLADLNAFLQEHRPTRDFSYALPVIWPGEPGLFRDLGRLRAKVHGEELHEGAPARRFSLAVEGPSGATGMLLVNAQYGYIIEARLSIPNHEEYRDFRLRLVGRTAGSAESWSKLLRGHYANCGPV